jgi:hypothetical protein
MWQFVTLYTADSSADPRFPMQDYLNSFIARRAQDAVLVDQGSASFHGRRWRAAGSRGHGANHWSG